MAMAIWKRLKHQLVSSSHHSSVWLLWNTGFPAGDYGLCYKLNHLTQHTQFNPQKDQMQKKLDLVRKHKKLLKSM